MFTVPPCRHLFTDGRQCGSPALRGTPLCFHHTAGRQPIPYKKYEDQTVPQLPAPDDFHAIQRGIAEVLRLLINDEVNDRRAATLLRGLAHASQNLARAHRHQKQNPALPVTDLVLHPTLGALALDPADTNVDVPQAASAGAPSLAALSPRVGSPQPQAAGAGEGAPSLAASSPRVGSPTQPEPTPSPVPTPNFTPHPALPLADEFRLGQFYLEIQARSAARREEFEIRKTAELDAEYEARYNTRAAELEARHQLLLQTAIQQNQDLRTKAEVSGAHSYLALVS